MEAEEPRVFHNRLSHSLKVGQLGRRLSEYLLEQERSPEDDWALDPIVAETAGLAHDIGHPPFAHVGEKTLDGCIRRTYKERHEISDPPTGFEGNAQSFRILTKIAVREGDYLGLDFTRASLNAVLKYPWAYEEDPRGEGKWGYYLTEEEDFRWARDPLADHDTSPETSRTLEAQVMDWADLVTYAIHDMTDFYRQGLLPLHRLLSGEHADTDRFARHCASSLSEDPELDQEPSAEEVEDTLLRIQQENREAVDSLTRRYRGTAEQRKAISRLTSNLLTDLLTVPESVSVEEGSLRIRESSQMQAKVLANMTGFFVYGNPAMEETNLPLQQERQRTIVKGLWEALYDEVEASIEDGKESPLVPMQFRPLIDRARENEAPVPHLYTVRITSDIISRLTDKQAATFYRQIGGMSEEPLRGGHVL